MKAEDPAPQTMKFGRFEIVAAERTQLSVRLAHVDTVPEPSPRFVLVQALAGIAFLEFRQVQSGAEMLTGAVEHGDGVGEQRRTRGCVHSRHAARDLVRHRVRLEDDRGGDPLKRGADLADPRPVVGRVAGTA